MSLPEKVLDSNKNGNSEDKIVTSENILVISKFPLVFSPH